MSHSVGVLIAMETLNYSLECALWAVTPPRPPPRPLFSLRRCVGAVLALALTPPAQVGMAN